LRHMIEDHRKTIVPRLQTGSQKALYYSWNVAMEGKIWCVG
jgi:hypothetical protein